MADDHPFEPILRETVSSQIRTQLHQRIMVGELAPGAPMPSERDLSEQFKVARTSVREAMQGLLSLGLIERRGNRSYVAEHLPDISVDPSDHRKNFVIELFETRSVLEVPIFQLATQRANDSERSHVVALAAAFTDDIDIGMFRRLDREFHTTIAASCGNPLLIELYGKVLDQLFRSREFDGLLSDEQNRSGVRRLIDRASVAHRAIADAYAARDPVAMKEATEAHLVSVEGSMVADLA